MLSKLTAEFLGTFWLVLGGCGSAVLAAAFPDVGIGLLGVSLAFGLTVLSGAYAFGPISGGHFNPAVSVGLWAGGRFPVNLLAPYTQPHRSSAVRSVRPCCSSSRAAIPAFSVAGGFASNGYGAHSPGGYSLAAALVCEVVMTAMFLLVILGTTHKRAPVGFAGLAIGLALTLIHLISIPVTNTSVNPARSTGDGALRRRLGRPAAVVVLAGAGGRSGDRRPAAPVASRQPRSRAAGHRSPEIVGPGQAP